MLLQVEIESERTCEEVVCDHNFHQLSIKLNLHGHIVVFFHVKTTMLLSQN
jgi:hypothetical protein